MNAGSVITNEETEEKLGWGGPFNFPKFSILDPTYTISVPKDQTIYGIVDMMSHMFEQYFNNAKTHLYKMRCVKVYCAQLWTMVRKLVEDLDNYDLRETILFAGTMGLNGFLQMGYQGIGRTHDIEHAVSAVYDIPHAGGLAILFPHWMRHNVNVIPHDLLNLQSTYSV